MEESKEAQARHEVIGRR
jgi:hypothetical protein